MAVAIQTREWTLAEMHRLPEDGNKYELVRGELFVTPAPRDEHESIAARLNDMLAPYVKLQGLGQVFRPRAVMRYRGSEVEPDLMVRARHPDRRGDDSDWTRAPIPILVVEILSDYTRHRDRREKKELYMDAGVAEYWIVDAEERSITVVRPGAAELTTHDLLSWSPKGASNPLSFRVADVFD